MNERASGYLRENTHTVYVETDRNVDISRDLLEPHYSDKRFFWKMHTVYFDPQYQDKTEVDQSGYTWINDAVYNYSDRILEDFGYEAYRSAYKNTSQKVGETKSVQFYETLLRELYSQPNLRLIHLVTGVNVSNGYPYKLFGTINPAQPEVK